jgi:hypothetical protein
MGTYPAMPAGYMYDLSRDGSVVRGFNDTSKALSATLTSGQVAQLQSMDNPGLGSGIYTIATPDSIPSLSIMFPVARTLTGAVLQCMSSTGNIIFYGSNDTTNGIDGTWSALTTAITYTFGTLLEPRIRTPIALSGTYTAIKMQPNAQSGGGSSTRFYTIQIFGTTQPSGLVLWDPSSDVVLPSTALDYEDIYVGGGDVTTTFRIKNTAAQTANNVVVSMDTASDYGIIDTETTFDIGGGFQASINITSLAPGAISSVITMKRNSPTVLSAGTIEMATLQAVATTWT